VFFVAVIYGIIAAGEDTCATPGAGHLSPSLRIPGSLLQLVREARRGIDASLVDPAAEIPRSVAGPNGSSRSARRALGEPGRRFATHRARRVVLGGGQAPVDQEHEVAEGRAEEGSKPSRARLDSRWHVTNPLTA
jgi:hypothetical protein